MSISPSEFRVLPAEVVRAGGFSRRPTPHFCRIGETASGENYLRPVDNTRRSCCEEFAAGPLPSVPRLVLGLTEGRHLCQFGSHSSPRSWTNLGEFHSPLSRSGVCQDDPPLRVVHRFLNARTDRGPPPPRRASENIWFSRKKRSR